MERRVGRAVGLVASNWQVSNGLEGFYPSESATRRAGLTVDALALFNLHLADVVGAHGAVDGKVALWVVELARSAIRRNNCGRDV